jgi:predicted RNase H-like HicB family nuclease
VVSKDDRRAAKLVRNIFNESSAYLPVHQGVSFMKKNFSVLVEKDEDGYLVATVPTLPGCHTQARSMDDLLERVKEAIEAYIEMQIIGD